MSQDILAIAAELKDALFPQHKDCPCPGTCTDRLNIIKSALTEALAQSEGEKVEWVKRAERAELVADFSAFNKLFDYKAADTCKNSEEASASFYQPYSHQYFKELQSTIESQKQEVESVTRERDEFRRINYNLCHEQLPKLQSQLAASRADAERLAWSIRDLLNHGCQMPDHAKGYVKHDADPELAKEALTAHEQLTKS